MREAHSLQNSIVTFSIFNHISKNKDTSIDFRKLMMVESCVPHEFVNLPKYSFALLCLRRKAYSLKKDRW